MRQLILGQVIKRIGLILYEGRGTPDGIAAVLQLPDPRIVSGGDIIRPDGPAPVKQCFPLYIPVAGNTRIRGVAVQILIRKVVDHIFPEILSEVHHIIRNAECSRHSPGVLHSA